MAGTIPLSLTQQFDEFGKPLNGGLLYIIQAGTVSTPQNPYQDAALSILMPNPIPLDAAGRVPQFFLADGYIKVRLTNAAGVTQLGRDGILVIGPSAGGGGGGGVDPTTLIQTGMLSIYYGTGALAGFVRSNGRTIGSATSGATERANVDCQALFIFLWGADPNLAISGGRGATGLADWNANKQLTLPDWRGRAIAALDDMGNAAAGRLANTFAGNAIVLGANAGVDALALPRSDLPNVAPTASFTGSSSTVNFTTVQATYLSGNSGSGFNNAGTYPSAGGASLAANVTPLGGVTVQSLNGGVAQTLTPKVQPTMLATIYLKL